MEGNQTLHALRALHVSSEVAPFSKVGGLADVAASLPPALRALGIDCRVLTPAWEGVLDEARNRGLRLSKISRRVEAAIRWRICRATVWKGAGDGGVFYFLDAPELFGKRIYPEDLTPDSVIPFVFLSLAALDLPEAAMWRPRILHAHDWPASPLIAALAWHTHYRTQRSLYRTVLTVHNLAHQGILPLESVLEWGLNEESLSLHAMEFYGRANLLKGALLASDRITTVSPAYVREIQTGNGGEGLEGVLRSSGHKLSGILNGLDTTSWDPAADPWLPASYSADDLSGRQACRSALLERLALQEDGRPIFVSVGRLVEQKGLDILIPALESLVEMGCRFFAIGSGESRYEFALRAAAERWPESVSVFTGFDEGLARLAYGGGDFFLMPSRFEPCGLSQLIALRYGSIPVVRAVGGLSDTVFEYGTPRGNGFLFGDYSPDALLSAVSRALKLFADRERTDDLRRAGMRSDFSWSRSAPAYASLYSSLAS